MTRRPWTAAEVRRLRELVVELGSIRDAAYRLGRTSASARGVLGRTGGSPADGRLHGRRRTDDRS